MVDYKLREMVAFHEAGHAVIGYLFGQKVTEININFDLSNNTPAYTSKEYGHDQTIIDCLSNNNINGLKSFNINRVNVVAQRFCCSLLSGPISETFYKYGLDYDKGITSQNTPDFNLTYNVASLIYKGQGIYNFIGDCSNLVSDILRENEVWSTIRLLSASIVDSKDLRLFEKEIYDCFNKGGLCEYKNRIENNASH